MKIVYKRDVGQEGKTVIRIAYKRDVRQVIKLAVLEALAEGEEIKEIVLTHREWEKV